MQIGTFKGKQIDTMSRDELLDFAVWASSQIQMYMKMEERTQDFRLNQEVKELLIKE